MRENVDLPFPDASAANGGGGGGRGSDVRGRGRYRPFAPGWRIRGNVLARASSAEGHRRRGVTPSSYPPCPGDFPPPISRADALAFESSSAVFRSMPSIAGCFVQDLRVIGG
jgi:hypothetical protein